MTRPQRRARPRRRVFVMGAYVPSGGGYMAYELGRILAEDFGWEALAICARGEGPEHGIRTYGLAYPMISQEEMEACIGTDDLLVSNASFSRREFGLRLRCRKLMYVQGFTTFQWLDRFFDHYVCASSFLARFLSLIYRVRARVIAPFVDHERLPSVASWRKRPERSLLVRLKGDATHQELLLARLRDIVAVRGEDVPLTHTLSLPSRIPQTQLLEDLGHHRYLLTLSVAEGFGLVPLEAMALGTTVLGFDGFGGRDYMVSGQNCATAPYPRLDRVADALVRVLRAPRLGEALARRGQATARRYTRERFRTAWHRELRRFL